MCVFFSRLQLYINKSLIYTQYFYSKSLNKILFVTPFALPSFFLFPCFLFLMDFHSKKGQNEGQVFSRCSISFCLLHLTFSLILPFLLDIILCASHLLDFPPWSLNLSCKKGGKNMLVFSYATCLSFRFFLRLKYLCVTLLLINSHLTWRMLLIH